MLNTCVAGDRHVEHLCCWWQGVYLVQIKRILGSGSVLRRNTVLRHYTEKIFNHPLEVRPSTDAPVGAALSVSNITWSPHSPWHFSITWSPHSFLNFHNTWSSHSPLHF